MQILFDAFEKVYLEIIDFEIPKQLRKNALRWLEYKLDGTVFA